MILCVVGKSPSLVCSLSEDLNAWKNIAGCAFIYLRNCYIQAVEIDPKSAVKGL